MTFKGDIFFYTHKIICYLMFSFVGVSFLITNNFNQLYLILVTLILILELEYREWKSFAILNSRGLLIEKYFLFGLIKIKNTSRLDNPNVLKAIDNDGGIFTFEDLNKQLNCTIKFQKVEV